jgi:deoxyribodipyrimidine photo-lyase
LYNRDLRTHDHPALAEACRQGGTVVPLFVIDPALTSRPLATSNRVAFLLESLADLRRSLIDRGGQLYVRCGDPTAATLKISTEVGASAVFASADFSPYARDRQSRLARACEQSRMRFVTFPGATVVPPGELVPGGADHYRVFTPYWRRWRSTPGRALWRAPRRVPGPAGVAPGPLPDLGSLSRRPQSPRRAQGDETAARRLARAWTRRHLSGYAIGHDDLAGDRTSRLSPYLHFGCISPADLAHDVKEVEGGETFLRQLCWRDFHHQVLSAFPDLPHRDYRPRGRHWLHDPAALEAWQHGLTGIPIVDAGMRQLLSEGWMANRARLLGASFLTRNIAIDWRRGAEHFAGWLLDADAANNSGNWQWVAGTGNDTRPNRRFNLLRQAHRYDARGDYVRRHIPELAGVAGPAVHEPWRLSPTERTQLDYPAPIIAPNLVGSR